MSTMHLDIVSAEEEIFSGTVKNLSAAAMMGEVGIFPKHTPMITPLKPGEIKVITEDGEEKVFFISGGVLEVQPDIVTVLADTAIRGEDLDEAKAVNELIEEIEKAKHLIHKTKPTLQSFKNNSIFEKKIKIGAENCVCRTKRGRFEKKV